MRAALKGAEQIGFTIMSLTVSLIAVLIPLLFMGDVVGRLFREFAITLAMTILVSAVVSLTLTPMMCSRILKDKAHAKQTRFYHWSENVFNRIIACYGRTLQLVLRYRFITLMVTIATLVATMSAVHRGSQGLFPGAGYRRDPWNQRGAAECELHEHGRTPTEARGRCAAGSGSGQRLLVHWRGRDEHDTQLGPHPDQL